MPDSYSYVLIGGGVASVTAVLGIREHDSEGSIAIVRDESVVPYDRPPLSKGFLRIDDMSLDDVSSKFDTFYPDNNVDLILGVRAVSVDRDRKCLKLNDGREVGYGKLLFATGARANMPAIVAEHTAVLPLRSLADAEAIRAKLSEVDALTIVGAGYIAVEVTGTALKAGKKVVVVAPDPYPWSGFASEATGTFIRSYYEDLGVEFRLGVTVTGISDGKVALSDGTELDAELVVMGTGVLPNVEVAESCGIKGGLEGIHADQFLATSDPDIYTCGDVAYLFDPRLGHQWRTEHHLHAKWTGQAAGANMAGAHLPYDKVPYFWSDFHEWHMVLRGYPDYNDHVVTFGDHLSGRFVELYADAGFRLRMGLALHDDEPKLDPISDKLEDLIRSGAHLQDIQAEDFAL